MINFYGSWNSNSSSVAVHLNNENHSVDDLSFMHIDPVHNDMDRWIDPVKEHSGYISNFSTIWFKC